MFINLLACVDATLANSAMAVLVSWRVADSSASVMIDDSGPASEYRNLFVPFYTTRAKGSGMGWRWRRIARAWRGRL
jgi:C4-dicarboxylate-specific signal transduction histidine kinase